MWPRWDLYWGHHSARLHRHPGPPQHPHRVCLPIPFDVFQFQLADRRRSTDRDHSYYAVRLVSLRGLDVLFSPKQSPPHSRVVVSNLYWSYIVLIYHAKLHVI